MEQRWINIVDRLPQESKCYLCIKQINGKIFDPYVATFVRSLFAFKDVDGDEVKPTHWMEIDLSYFED